MNGSHQVGVTLTPTWCELFTTLKSQQMKEPSIHKPKPWYPNVYSHRHITLTLIQIKQGQSMTQHPIFTLKMTLLPPVHPNTCTDDQTDESPLQTHAIYLLIKQENTPCVPANQVQSHRKIQKNHPYPKKIQGNAILGGRITMFHESNQDTELLSSNQGNTTQTHINTLTMEPPNTLVPSQKQGNSRSKGKIGGQ
jgi:hypothetical protein